LRISEGRDLGEIDRFKFYDHTKVYTAAPPDVLRANEKHLKEYYVVNCLGLIVTTNHKSDGLYLPADDRRHFVAWSNFTKEDFAPDYWNALWGFYYDGGFEHVTAYLSEFDLSSFDPKAPPPKTPAFWQIVGVNAAPEDAELMDVLDKLKNPEAVTVADLIEAATAEMAEWLLDRRNRRALPHRLERCGYVSLRNSDSKQGLWLINGQRQMIYVCAELRPEQQLGAARKLVRS
jgi:hypothetical protein